MSVFDPVFGRGEVLGGDPAAAWPRALLEVEAALARALERAGLAPAGAGSAVTAAAEELMSGGIAALVSPGAGPPGAPGTDPLGAPGADPLGTGAAGNPVPGLARLLGSRVPAEYAGAVHRGATSQDIIDTAMMLLASRGLAVIGDDLAASAAGCARLAADHRDTVMIGRTLLQQAVPVTFGLMAAGWLTAVDDARAGLATVRDGRLAVQFGGAAGTLAALDAAGPRVAALLAAELGLAVPVLPWHTDRLRLLDVAAALARCCAALGKIARDVTLLSQSEVGEVTVGSPGGSSAMPHKRNPVAAVAVLGCARQAPGLLATLAAGAEQEYQRAAGAWHAEWEPYTALLRLTGSAAAWSAELVTSLVVDVPRMTANLASAKGLPLAEHVAALAAGVLGRAAAHDLVAEASHRAVAAGLPLRDVLLGAQSFADELASAGVLPEEIEAALEPSGYLGASGIFVDAALAAHDDYEASEGSHG